MQIRGTTATRSSLLLEQGITPSIPSRGNRNRRLPTARGLQDGPSGGKPVCHAEGLARHCHRLGPLGSYLPLCSPPGPHSLLLLITPEPSGVPGKGKVKVRPQGTATEGTWNRQIFPCHQERLRLGPSCAVSLAVPSTVLLSAVVGVVVTASLLFWPNCTQMAGTSARPESIFKLIFSQSARGLEQWLTHWLAVRHPHGVKLGWWPLKALALAGRRKAQRLKLLLSQALMRSLQIFRNLRTSSLTLSNLLRASWW